MRHKLDDIVEIDPSADAHRFYAKFGPFKIVEVVEKVEKGDPDEKKERFKKWGPHYMTIPMNSPKAKLLLYERELNA